MSNVQVIARGGKPVSSNQSPTTTTFTGSTEVVREIRKADPDILPVLAEEIMTTAFHTDEIAPGLPGSLPPSMVPPALEHS